MIHSKLTREQFASTTPVEYLREEQFPLIQFINFYLFAAVWFAVILYLSRAAVDQGQLWLVIITALLIAIPALLAILYTDTVALIHKSGKYKANSHLRRLTTGRILSTILWTTWSIGFGFATVFWLNSSTHLEIGSLFLSIAVLYLFNTFMLKLTRAEMEACYANASAIRWARVMMALVMTALFLSALSITETNSETEALAARLSAVVYSPMDTHKSTLVHLATELSAILQQFRAYLIDIAQTATPWYLLAICAGTFGLFFNFSFMISGFLIPMAEYRRIFAPLSSSDSPEPIALSTTIFTSAIVTFFFFLLLPAISGFELYVREKLASPEILANLDHSVITVAERIDDVLYMPGTMRQVNEAKFDMYRNQSASISAIRKRSSQAFDAMRQNVDTYLDSYYSLPAEYLRILGVLTGKTEEIITNDLKKSLMDGPAFSTFQRTMSDELEKQPRIVQAYREQVATILSENKIGNPKGEVIVVSSSSNPLESPPEHAVLVSLDQRMGAAGVGAIGGIVAAKVVSKVAAKGTIKLAAKAVAKLGTSKLAGGAAGAAAGAAAGSVIPVAGTLTGTVIGFTAGIVMGFSVDALLLQLEENFSRGEFKAQIIAAIDEQEREFFALSSN